MDSLICQAYYNPALITVLDKLIIGDSRKSGSANTKRIKIQDTDFSHVGTSNLYHIKVPKYYHGKRYKKLFDNLTTRRFMIPLGLYRTTKVNLLAYNEQLNGDRPLKKPSDMGNNENQMNPNQFN